MFSPALPRYKRKKLITIISVLYRTTAAPRQSANSCKHDLSLRSPCAFFDRLENGKLIEEKSSYIVDFSGFCTIFAPNVAKEGMEIIFNEKYLQEMYLTGQTDKKHRYQPQVVCKYIRVQIYPRD